MSNIPIPDIGGLAKSFTDFLAFWNNFKNKRMRIIGPSTSHIHRDEEFGGHLTLHVFKEIIEGIVMSAQAYPPGIVLKEVVQFVRHEKNHPLYGIGKEEPAHWIASGFDSPKRELFDVKFVSFNYIQSIEFLEK